MPVVPDDWDFFDVVEAASREKLSATDRLTDQFVELPSTPSSNALERHIHEGGKAKAEEKRNRVFMKVFVFIRSFIFYETNRQNDESKKRANIIKTKYRVMIC